MENWGQNKEMSKMPKAKGGEKEEGILMFIVLLHVFLSHRLFSVL